MVVVIQWLTLVVLAFCLINTVWHVLDFPSLERLDPLSPGTKVSVMVPARNEAPRIEACVRSLLAQDWQDLEVLVLDDRSDDGTAEILAAIHDPRLKVLKGESLPVGWAGKNWACHQLSGQASGDWFAFLDADTVCEAGAISSLVGTATRMRSDLLCAWAYQVVGGWMERSVVPLLGFAAATLSNPSHFHKLQDRPEAERLKHRDYFSNRGVANGQCLLFTRSSYQELGGHEAIRGDMMDDLSFATRVAQGVPEGRRLINCDGGRFIRCRMYHSSSEVWNGFTRSAWSATHEHPAFNICLTLVGFIIGFGPFVFWALPWANRPLAFISLGMLMGMRLMIGIRHRRSLLEVLLLPVGLVVTALIALNAIRLAKVGVSWKGRSFVPAK